MTVAPNLTRELADRFVMPTYKRLPVTFVRGEGTRLFDEAGKEYIDLVAGIAVVAIGHSHPAVTQAVGDQAGRLMHTSNLYYTEPMALLAEKLTSLLGWDDGRVFFANSGAEANECAIKLVRKWAGQKFGPGRYETIAAFGSFHGRTLETLAATGQPEKWKLFSPLPPGFRHVAYDDPAAIEGAIDESVSSVLLEPVLGEGGVVVPSDDYLPAVRKICDTHSLAFIADEVQTGLGRTGEWFAHQASTGVPDVITLAKALGNGLPIGACVARGELATAFAVGDHATTMGGGPVVAAAALAVLETIEKEHLVDNARRVGNYLKAKLSELISRHDLVTAVRGRGLLLAVQFSRDVAREVVLDSLADGLLVNDVTPSAIRISPPLTLSEPDCDQAIEILDHVITGIGDSTK